MAIYYRQTTFQQRRYLFELAELLGSVSEACRLEKVSRNTYYYHWEPRYEKEGIEKVFGSQKVMPCITHTVSKTNHPLKHSGEKTNREHRDVIH
ncbi:MAG: hypothetical protein WAV32_08050 [Halobacteriota archaeon]